MKSIELHSQIDVVGFYKNMDLKKLDISIRSGILHQICTERKRFNELGFYEK